MEHLQIIDWIIIVTFLILTFGIGIWSSRSIKKGSDFFLSGRKLGPALQFFINFGQMTDASGAPQLTAFVYTSGVGGAWASFQTLFLTPFYWFTSIWFRRTRLVTGSDLFMDRFNSPLLSRGFAWYFVFLVPMYLALGNVISYKVSASLFTKPESSWTTQERQNVDQYNEWLQLKHLKDQKQPLTTTQTKEFEDLDSLKRLGKIDSIVPIVSEVTFLIGYTTFVALYIVLGGIKGAAYADALQGLLILGLSAVLLPFGFYRVGGFTGLHQMIHDKDTFQLLNVLDPLSWFIVIAYVLNGMASMPAPTWITNNAAARDETALRVGMLGGGFSKRIVMIGWIFCALLAVALLPGISDPDKVWGRLSITLLPPGLLGLMVVGLLIGHMPLVAVAAVNFSATFTRNIYQEIFPNRSSKHYLLVAQASVFGILVVGLILALAFTGIDEIYTAILVINPFAGAVAWLIYFWRGLSHRAVAWGAVIWFLVMVFLPWGLPFSSSFSQIPSLTITSKEGTALFFEDVVRSNPEDPNSPLTGIRRFTIENWICYHILQIPLQDFKTKQLKVMPIIFSAIFPFVILIGLSYALPARRLENVTAPKTLSQAEKDEIARMIDGNLRLPYRENETPEQEEVRIQRFYSKMMMPIGKTPEEDAKALEKAYTDPFWYRNWKIFQKSKWEFVYLSTTDSLGFFGSFALVFVILAAILFLLQLGS